jgi:DNA-binding NtrC family response regulator
MYAPKNQRVMVVDDEEGVRLSWNRFLSDRGFDVTTAEDGEHAITRLQEKPADVVISDLRMPGIDGLQLLQWMNDSELDTRFILLTGYGNEEVEARARELGAYEYLNKPISPEALSAVITGALALEPRARLAIDPTTTVADLKAVIDKPAMPALEVAGPAQGKTLLKVAGGLVMAPILGLAFVLFLPVMGFALFFKVVAEAVTGKGKQP